ncbi:MAG: hypothetical protein Q4B70_17310 [Lachnospiraceae bacterium]|nr:hypothetical protein [Lachnospiraceae bacterium]
MVRLFYLSNDKEITLVNKHIIKKRVRLLEEEKMSPYIGRIVLEGTEKSLNKLEGKLKSVRPPRHKGK